MAGRFLLTFLIFSALVFNGCASVEYRVQSSNPPKMSVAKAKALLRTVLTKEIEFSAVSTAACPSGIRKFELTREGFRVKQVVGYEPPKCIEKIYDVECKFDKSAELEVYHRHTWYWVGVCSWYFNLLSDAQQLADIMYTLSHARPQDWEAEDPAFLAAVKMYRSANPKPPIPESVRRFQIQAEYATEQKHYDAAIDAYAQGLEAAPWWPEGHYNRAMLLGHQQRFDEAALEMKRYLQLAPEASDARTAQDQIYKWEAAAK